MIKIIFLVPGLRKCGPINQLFYILKNLNRKIYYPIVLSISNNIDEIIKEKIESLNIEIISLKKDKFISWDLIYKASKLITNLKPNLLHSLGIKGDILALFLRKNYLPIITTARNYAPEDYPSILFYPLGLLMGFIHIYVLKRHNNVIACSQSIKLKLKKHKIISHVICNGVDFYDSNHINNENKIKIRNFLKVPDKVKVFVVVGELIKRKNVGVIINAFKNNDNKNCFLLIIGDGPLKTNLQKISNKNIIFTGRVNDVYPYLKCADVFISASFSEGLPNSVLEACSLNLPCILSDIPAHKEIVGNNQNNLFNPNDQDKLSELINKALKEKYSLFKYDFDDIRRKFSAELMSNNYQNFYKKVLDSSIN